MSPWTPEQTGWRDALSGISEDRRRFDDPQQQARWLAGYRDAEQTRSADVAAVRAAVADQQ